MADGFLPESGSFVSEYQRQHFGRVMLKNEIIRFKDIDMLDERGIAIQSEGISEDPRNEFFRSAGKPATRSTTGGS